MYWVTPFHYLVSALVGQVIGHQDINCATNEFVTLEPPTGTSCGSFMTEYITRRGGYLLNEAATSACQFCSTRTTDEFLRDRVHIKYSEHWWYMGKVFVVNSWLLVAHQLRSTGIFIGYIFFNVSRPCL